MTLYHWTQRRNVRAILTEGLRPDKSRGKANYVWLADRNAALEMLAHIAIGQGTQPNRLCLLRVRIPRSGLLRFSRPGVYRSDRVIDPAQIQWVSPAVLWLHLPFRILRNP